MDYQAVVYMRKSLEYLKMLHGIRKNKPPECVQQILDKDGFVVSARMMLCPDGCRYIHVKDLESMLAKEALHSGDPKCRACLYNLLDKIKRM